MMKLSDIGVEVTEHERGLGVLVIKGGFKFGAQLECIPDAKDDTIRHVKEDIWQMVYGDLEAKFQQLWHTAINNAELGKINVVDDACQQFLKLLKPENNP